MAFNFDLYLQLLFSYCLQYAVPFRNRERITFDHLASMKKPDETALIRVLRDGKECEFNITLRPVSHSSSFCQTCSIFLLLSIDESDMVICAPLPS